jgi:phosphoribosylformylglycinamidine synthase subunit PurL
MAAAREAAEKVRALIAAGTVTAVHDVSDGGLAVTLAEMALASGIGATVEGALDAGQAFGEDQGRYVVTAPAGKLIDDGKLVRRIGTTGGDTVLGAAIADLRGAHEGFFPALMGAETAL